MQEKQKARATKKKMTAEQAVAGGAGLPESQEDGRKNRAIYGLILGLIGAILITYSIRANAATNENASADASSGPIAIEVIQEGNILTASAAEPLRIESWRAIRTSDQQCEQAQFTDNPNLKRERTFRLQDEDVGQRYCFRARDNDGHYSYQLSPPVDDLDAN